MSIFKPAILIGAVATGLGLVAAVAIAADGPRVEKRDIVIHVAPPAFADIDANKDGNISQSEFDSFHAAHKPSPEDDDLPPPPPVGKRMRMKVLGGEGLDANKDGKVSFAEFSGPMKAHFDELDANKDGVLDKSELPKDRLIDRRRRD